MKNLFLLFLGLFLSISVVKAHVYVIIYATHDGKTGHAGIAVDNYRITVQDCRNCPGRARYDTVYTGDLSYFDLWPLHDDFNKTNLASDQAAQYYSLPASSSEPRISVSSLVQKGIPHEEGYACDGLLKIKTTKVQDYQIKQYILRLIEEKHAFNAWDFNCADFVEHIVEHVLQQDIDADEYIMMKKATTPNKLCKTLMDIPGVLVLKNPGDLIRKDFFSERVLRW